MSAPVDPCGPCPHPVRTGNQPRRHGHFLIWQHPAPETDSLLAHLLPHPDQVLDSGTELPSPWRGKATKKTRVTLDGRDYFLKRYNCSGWGYRLKNAFRASRARRSWLAAHRFVDAAIPTPVPLLCIEERHLLLLGRSYLIFPFIAGEATSFLDLWPRLNSAQQRHSLTRLGTLLGAMHRQQLCHGDLNWRNILAVSANNRLHFSLVDLDGSTKVTRMTPAMADADLDHFLRDLDRNRTSPELRSLFLEHWRQTARLTPLALRPD